MSARDSGLGSARRPPSRQRSFDYVIVGAGSAGCALASRLAEVPGNHVLLLEQGPTNSRWSVRIPAGLRENFKPGGRYMRWYSTVPQRHLGGRIVEHPRGFGLGGSSLVNGMVYLRGHPADYDRWAAEGAMGWSYAEVLPYFRRMERRAEGADAFRGGEGPVGVRRQAELHPLNDAFLEAGRQAGFPFTQDVNGAQQEGFCRFDMNVDGGYRASAAYAYLERRRPAATLSIETGVVGCRLIFEGRRAVGVEARQGSRTSQIFAEREVILSAGAIGSPQLLLLSGVGPVEELRRIGIKPVLNLPGVGQNLQDHLELDLQWECTQPISVNGLLKPQSIARIGLQWLLFKSGLAAVNQCHVGAFVRSAPQVDHPNIQLHFFPLCFDGWVPRRDRHGFRISAGPLRQTSRGTLRLRSVDPRDPPRLDPNYLATENDLEELRQAYALILEIVSQPAFDPYRGEPLEPAVLPRSRAEIDQLIRRFCGSGYHLCGTCKMGDAGDPSAVVDPACRVRGLEGLRIVDGSIIPSIVSSNLNAPIMMIGERAADLILGKPVPEPPADASLSLARQ